LKSQYPNSDLIGRLDPQIEKLKKYLKITAVEYDKAKIVETNYLKFTDLLETFKGKNILIDVWATWCGPCVEDFVYKSSLKKFIDEGQLVTLYISIDQLRWEKKWKENMKYNQLEGYHVLANQELIVSMWGYLRGKEGQIPRYALIDKNGQMILNDAARPSDGDKLEKQVESLITK
jgi:thiol-disulfide isomerase/thioredoxin